MMRWTMAAVLGVGMLWAGPARADDHSNINREGIELVRQLEEVGRDVRYHTERLNLADVTRNARRDGGIDPEGLLAHEGFTGQLEKDATVDRGGRHYAELYKGKGQRAEGRGKGKRKKGKGKEKGKGGGKRGRAMRAPFSLPPLPFTSALCPLPFALTGCLTGSFRPP